MLVAGAELIAQMCGHAWFDAARTNGDQEQAKKKTHSRIVQRQGKVAQAVHDRQREDGSVFTEQPVRDDRSENRQKIDPENKFMKPPGRLVIIHDGELAIGAHEISRHEEGQNRTHPIKAESFCSFVPDDVRDPGRHSGEITIR